MSLKITKIENSEIVLLSNVRDDFSIPELGIFYKLNKREIHNSKSENTHLAVINRPEVPDLYEFSKNIIEKLEKHEDVKNTDNNVWVNIHWNNHNNNSNFKPNNTITYGFKQE